LEERVDHTEETDSKLAQAQELINSSPQQLPTALSLLFALEKKCRVGNDTPSLVRVVEASLQLCKECSDDEALISTLKTLSSRRSQKSKAVSALVSKAIPWVLQCDDFTPLEVTNDDQKEIRERIVVVLRDITDGKLFLEAERARLTRALAILKERDGKVAEAADVLQEVHIETYGSLSKREKVEFLLEQIRLTLEKKDYVRAHIVANKVNRKVLGEEGMEDEKVRFFTLMLEYHQHQEDAFELAKDYHQIYSTITVQNNEENWKLALTNTVVFLVLSAYTSEQQDMMNRINLDPKLKKIPECKETLKLFLKKEIIAYPTPHQSALESLPSVRRSSADDEAWPKVFRTRVVQHNVRIAALYYDRIEGRRLAEILGLEHAALEQEISKMVSDGSVYAKIDRPNDVIRFKARKSPEEILSDWGADIKHLLNLVESTTHLIHKEISTQ